MNHIVASAYKELIQDLPFVDKLAGLVRTIEMKQSGDGQAFTLKRFPAACDVTQDACHSEAYRDLMPGSKYKSVIYFEDNGMDFLKKDNRHMVFRSKLTLICWIDTSKFKDAGCSLSGYAFIALASVLPLKFSSAPYIHTAIIESISQPEAGSNLFSRYTYDEQVSQYLFWPYQAFAMNIATQIWVNPAACLDDLEIETDVCLTS